MFLDKVLELVKPRSREIFGHRNVHFPVDLAHCTFTQSLLQPGQIFADVGQDHVVDIDSAFFHILVEDVLTDYGLRPAIRELVFNFAARVDRTDRRYDRSSLESAEICDHVLGAIEKMKCDAVPFHYSQCS
jgi:hypothetical protein